MLTPADVEKMAHLAHLAVKTEDIEPLCQDLSTILRFIQQLEKIDTCEVTPVAHSYETTQPLREDCITEMNQREDFQRIAPETEAGFYIVPQFVE